MWAAILPVLDSGAAALDFDLHFPRYDLTPDSPDWTRITWHELRDRIIRLCDPAEFPHTALGKAISSVQRRRHPGND